MDLNAYWTDGRLTVTWDTPYEVQERLADGVTIIRVIESGQGPVDKDLPIVVDPGHEIDVVVP